ncbi:hypothetical protein LTR95_001130 [Oleoguttula sp. CCFEE 5521]
MANVPNDRLVREVDGAASFGVTVQVMGLALVLRRTLTLPGPAKDAAELYVALRRFRHYGCSICINNVKSAQSHLSTTIHAYRDATESEAQAAQYKFM